MMERAPSDPHFLIIRSDAMRSLFETARRLSDAPVSVLIEGESGVGKELLARALHEWGRRGSRRFVVGNCAAIPEALAEAELFGHVIGAFTGALRERRGMFEAADGGTFFLDELGEMSLAVQAKLLRVLEDGEFRRLGENDARRANVRIVAATNRDLEREVREGRFREDLFYRLAVVRLRVPALRERAEEIPELARHFLSRAAARSGRSAPLLGEEAVGALCAYRWPGNARELRNEMERAVALLGGSGRVTKEDLSDKVRGAPVESAVAESDDVRLRERIDRIERCLIAEALERYNWNKSRAARELGMTRQGLAKKMARFGMPAKRGMPAWGASASAVSRWGSPPSPPAREAPAP